MVEIVRQTYIKGFFISTVLPSDTHGLYETMVFETNADNEVITWNEVYNRHSQTKQEAKETHNEAVIIYEFKHFIQISKNSSMETDING